MRQPVADDRIGLRRGTLGCAAVIALLVLGLVPTASASVGADLTAVSSPADSPAILNETVDETEETVEEAEETTTETIDETEETVEEAEATTADTTEPTADATALADGTLEPVESTSADTAGTVEGATAGGTSTAGSGLRADLRGTVGAPGATLVRTEATSLLVETADRPLRAVIGTVDGTLSTLTGSVAGATTGGTPTRALEPESVDSVRRSAAERGRLGTASPPPVTPIGRGTADRATDRPVTATPATDAARRPAGRQPANGPGGSPPGPTAGFGALLIGVIGLRAVVVSNALPDGPRLWRALWSFRYSRYDDSDPLDHDDRRALFRRIEEHPGTNLSALANETGVPLSTARYHLRVLKRERLVDDATVNGKRRFAPLGSDHHEWIAALDDEATAHVLRTLDRIGPASVSTLAEELDRDPSTVTHHLLGLEETGLVSRRRAGRSVVNRLTPSARQLLVRDARDRPGGSR